jgi:hypothetical protein
VCRGLENIGKYSPPPSPGENINRCNLGGKNMKMGRGKCEKGRNGKERK